MKALKKAGKIIIEDALDLIYYYRLTKENRIGMV